MNSELQNFARQQILDGLKQLTPENHMVFKRMYSHKELNAPIEAVVANMSEDKLDWAMQQVQRSVEDLKRSRTIHDGRRPG